jgi:outer membrane lipopolysaccharide assembly protein LptE/RlpB
MEKVLNVVCSENAPKLQIVNREDLSRQISLSSNNNISQYSLTKSLTFSLISSTGTILIQNMTITTQRPLTINNNVILGSLGEKEIILEEMEHDLNLQLRFSITHAH